MFLWYIVKIPRGVLVAFFTFYSTYGLVVFLSYCNFARQKIIIFVCSESGERDVLDEMDDVAIREY